MRIDGACHCGAISVEGEAYPDKTVICHCTDCQTRHRLGVPRFGPGSRRHVHDDRAAVALSEDYRRRQRQSAPAGLLPALRLADLSTTPGDGRQEWYVVRVGILRQRDRLVPRRQIWSRSARPWLGELGNIPHSATEQSAAPRR